MAIPKHDEIRIPAMKLIQEFGARRVKDFVTPLAEHFKLTDNEYTQDYASGNGPIFYDRITWALSYLSMSGLVVKPKRGVCDLSKKGVELLQTPDKINDYIDVVIAKRDAEKKNQKEDTPLIDNSTESTPQEILYNSFDSIKKTVFDEILDTVLSKNPLEFEKLVVQLLQKMGYGGEIKDSGLVTKASNDGGIDGIIKEDVLGLGRIHIQAKRYAKDNTVSRGEIQGFVGALAVAQSNKGVFITTSKYSKGALEYAENLNGSTTLVLIDGNKLAEYMYDFGLGMQVEQTIEIKKLDADYWDAMQDRTD
ncbi:MAG: restriction endonuclease [Flavobacteriales bacterium]|nr:MAG: restriction endonuclease [Flavobacteriales bacterium]